MLWFAIYIGFAFYFITKDFHRMKESGVWWIMREPPILAYLIVIGILFWWVNVLHFMTLQGLDLLVRRTLKKKKAEVKNG